MDDFRISPELAEKAFSSPRFEVLGKLDVDVATIGTWDPTMSRRTRILVPVDVQAYVVPEGGVEETVAVTGDRDTDPAPFAVGAPKAPGVHLHWAMPDALLVADHDEETRTPRLPHLPDQWVVVRTLQPVGQRQALATGWVIDARTQVVTPLASFTGVAGDLPPEAPPGITGFTFGVEWTSSYAGSERRLTFHDSLEDLPKLASAAQTGFHGDQAVYTVAGWWSDESLDPLTGARGPAALDSVLAGLGWRVDHDADDAAHASSDGRERRMMKQSGLASKEEIPKSRIVGSDGRTVSSGLVGVDLEVATPVSDIGAFWVGETLPRYHALLHGSVLGVPVGEVLPAADDRPDPAGLTVALGSDVDDVVAALGADGIGLGEPDRRAAEDLMAAFSNGLIAEMGSPDGIDALGSREHENGFWSLPGTPLPGAVPDRLRREDSLTANPMTVGRKGRSAAGPDAEASPILAWRAKTDLIAKSRGRTNPKAGRVAPESKPAPTPRSVTRPAPRFFRPAPLVLAVREAHPSHRHHGDGLYDDQGRLLCRYPAAAVPRLEGLVTGQQVLPTLGSGAIPPEVVTVVREAVLLNPYGIDWLVAGYQPGPDLGRVVGNRLKAEMVRLYGVDGAYDGRSHIAFAAPKGPKARSERWDAEALETIDLEHKITAAMAELAIVVGQQPSPVAFTTWRQPWVPVWVEWRVTLTGAGTLRGWRLDGYDLEPDPDAAVAPDVATTLTGRSLLGQGVGETIRAAVRSWVGSEQQRQVTAGRTSFGDGTVVQKLADFDRPLDLVSASLDGIREQLLGIDYLGSVRRVDGKPVANGAATPLFGGRLRLDDLRLVDAFGRVVAVPEEVLDETRSTLELEVDDDPRTVLLRPRLQNAARWLFRLVDPGQDPATPAAEVREAYVDQVSPDDAVNPVAGFLLPDHIDEGLEAFTAAGTPLGQVAHDVISAAVTWECAPGRPLPPDAGPLAGLGAQERLVGEVVAGMVRADAAARALPEPPASSALVTFLRAVDTTLWAVDTFASLGTNTLAGLVGRPIAVVRALLTLDAPDDVAEVTITDAGGAAARLARFGALVEEEVEVQVGTLTRGDDTVLGFFVDDDYERLFLVDRVVAEHARVTGPQVGHLGLLGTVAPTAIEALDHPYLSTSSRIRLRPGQTRRLTLLMLPGGRAHLTSGVLPRKELALADSWFTPGLAKLMPSVRVGPLLIDPGEVRLPLVAVLGERQTFTRRTGDLAWKDDAILAATQTAYLPRMPHEIQEGWIRVTPDEGGTTP
ncbi:MULTISPECIES: hypothetical protein [unclassified Nocardioides]|uniref:hypothetical protein n=1 Tax=unclassified Nocardioides TaxID=2615069 RepID=UPI003616C17F